MSITITNTFADATTIESAKVNENFEDIGLEAASKSAGEEISGMWTFSEPILATSPNRPVYRFINDLDCGFYRNLGNSVGFTMGQTNSLRILNGQWRSLVPAATGANYIELEELSIAPSNPDADRFALYVRDNGSGKSQAVVHYSSGDIVVLATEP